MGKEIIIQADNIILKDELKNIGHGLFGNIDKHGSRLFLYSENIQKVIPEIKDSLVNISINKNNMGFEWLETMYIKDKIGFQFVFILPDKDFTTRPGIYLNYFVLINKTFFKLQFNNSVNVLYQNINNNFQKIFCNKSSLKDNISNFKKKCSLLLQNDKEQKSELIVNITNRQARLQRFHWPHEYFRTRRCRGARPCNRTLC